MTINDAQRAMLVEFAVRQAGVGASLEMMLGICYVIRNRARSQWEEGSWIRVMERAHLVAAHEPEHVEIDPDNRAFQRLLREVDDLYYGIGDVSQGNMMQMGDAEAGGGISLQESLCSTTRGKKHWALYWMDVRRPVRPWFAENIVRDRKNHPQRVVLGTMMFFE